MPDYIVKKIPKFGKIKFGTAVFPMSVTVPQQQQQQQQQQKSKNVAMNKANVHKR